MKIGDRVRVEELNQHGAREWKATNIQGVVLEIARDVVLLDLGAERGYYHIEGSFERVVPA